MSNFIVDTAEYGGVQVQLGDIVKQVAISTSTTGAMEQWEKKVNAIKYEEIIPRDQKMTSDLYAINVEIKETVVGLCSVGIWTGSPKIYSSSSAASNALNIFGDARVTSDDQVLSVIVSSASTGSSTGLTTTGSVSIGATEYINVPVGAAISQFNNGSCTAFGRVGINTGNLIVIRDVGGQFVSNRAVSISTTGEGPGGFEIFTFPLETGFVGVTSMRKDFIEIEMYDSYEPTYTTSGAPKASSTKVGLTSSNVGLGYSQFYYPDGGGFVGPSISNGTLFPKIENSKMAKLAYTTDNTVNNNQVTPLTSGISTYRVGIPTYLAASCKIKEYKTSIQDIVWLYKKGAFLTSDSASKYQSWYDAMDQGDPEMNVNVPPLPDPADRPVDDDEIDV